MRPRQPFPDHVRQLAFRQGGVLIRSQLIEAGFVDSQVHRLVEQGLLRRLDLGVYLLGQTPPTWTQWAWAGVLAGGRGSRLMRRSAGALLNLVPESIPIEVAVGSKLTDREWVSFVRQSSAARSAASTGAPPRTLTPDTVLDLCAVAADEAAVVHLLTTACQRQTTPTQLLRALARRPRLRHRRLISDVLAEVVDGVRSPLELRWVRDVERPHGLPRPDRNQRMASGRYADVRYAAYRLLIELDGRAYHQDVFGDWRRDNVHSEDGWLTMRYGWTDVLSRSCATAGNAARVLQNRGWDGQSVRCPRCLVDPSRL